LTEDITDVSGKVLTFASYNDAFYACEVFFPVCVGISYKQLNGFTINKSVIPVKFAGGKRGF
jgi:hypothetical protein